jgi:hypothetical protein
MLIASGTATIVNSVFAYNEAEQAFGAIASQESNTRISNSIFWNNSAPLFSDVASIRQPDLLQISHSIVQEPLKPSVVNRGGVMIVDPLFIDPDGADNIAGTRDDDFHLSGISPAIDSGVNDSLLVDFLDIDADGNTSELWPTDISNLQRIYDGSGSGPIVDMGVHEFDASTIGSYTFNTDYGATSPFDTAVLQVFPNPVTQEATLIWNLAQTENADLVLFDIIGKHVRTIYRGSLSPNDRIRFSRKGLAAGMYFIIDRYTLSSVRIIILD